MACYTVIAVINFDSVIVLKLYVHIKLLMNFTNTMTIHYARFQRTFVSKSY